MKKNPILFVYVFFFLVHFNSCPIQAFPPDGEYLAFAEEMPQPVGGVSAVIKKIKYPEIAKRAKVQGKVYVMVFVDESGKPTDAKVIKGIGAGCDEAAIEAAKKAKYTPGKNKGVPQKVKLSLAIEFKLS